MSAPGPSAMGFPTKSWPTTVAPSTERVAWCRRCQASFWATLAAMLFNESRRDLPRNAMRPNRLQCGDIAAHSALLVTGPDMCWRGGRIRCWKLTSPRPNRWPYTAMNSPASYRTTMRSSISSTTTSPSRRSDEITFESWLEEMISFTKSDDTLTGCTRQRWPKCGTGQSDRAMSVPAHEPEAAPRTQLHGIRRRAAVVRPVVPL